ncbi:MAG TPA: hypothetical protein VGU90_06195 [Terriglobales bacterium]|nr:hypothetical protein [Terriglobales bacterium]
MGRFASRATLAFVALSCIILFASCSSSNPTRVVANQIPGSVSLAPSPNVSLELGKIQAFSPTARNSAGTALNETFSFQSSNPAVVTISNNGIACAGTWDSVTAPVVCTPGSTGTAQVTVSARGVSSPPVTVYVHQHITNIVIGKIPNQPPTLSTSCLSKRAPSGDPESLLYQAFAFSGGIDITSSVGPFSWQAVALPGRVTNAVSLATPAAGAPGCVTSPQGQCLNQQSATANAPGSALFFASASGVNSQPAQFTTCPVQTISLSALSNPATSFVVNTGTTTTLNATVTDILGMTITGGPLTWSSSNQTAVKVPAAGATSTVFGSVGSVSASAIGAGAVTASCIPPTCNGGITPSLPIYPKQAISFDVNSSTAPAAPTVLVSTTGCSPSGNPSNQSCTTRVVPITRTGTNVDFVAGSPVTLPFAPNSLAMNAQGSNAYLGVDSLSFGSQAAMVLNGSSVSQVSNVAGKVLATSPDGGTAVFSDTTDSPNRVFICQGCNSNTSQNVSTFLFDGATAAAFSPDNIAGGFKAYVVSGQPCPGAGSPGCLLVFSKVDAPRLVPLSAPATDVAFIGNGTLGYIAGGDPAGTAFLPTCDDPAAGSIVAVGVASDLIRPLPDGQSALALAPPNVQTVTATIGGLPAVGVPGCPAPRGFLTIDNAVAPAVSLGTGSFTPTQFFLSPKGSAAYVLGQTGSGSVMARLPFIIAFDLTTDSPSNISLAGNATPLSASLSPSGDLLFVGADDGMVHVINTATQLDTQQIALTFPQSSLCIGPGNPATQVETLLTIAGASQSGSSTTYSYASLTGPALQTGETIIIRGLTDLTNNGTFTIASMGSGTFTVVNANGVTATGQNGTATSGIICNPDLVAVKP